MVALGIDESALGVSIRNVRSSFESSFNHFTDGILSNSAPPAVIGFEPIGKLLGAFARIACGAASGDVFAINHSGIVYDVFPCRRGLSGLFGRPKFNATVNAVPVPILDLSF